jgi:50S ribosomal protein L16 3-hydroxylase
MRDHLLVLTRGISVQPMNAEAFFNSSLPAFVVESEELVRLGAVYLFRITGDGGGVWTLDLKSSPPFCCPGEAGPFDCRIEMSHADFESMLSQPEQSRNLFYENRIKLSGSMMFAAHIPTILTLSAASVVPPGLAALISPVSTKQFMTGYWPDKALAVHGSASRFRALTEIPELRDPYALLAVWPFKVRRSGQREGSLVSPGEARECYDRGCTLNFDMAEQALPALQVWLAKLRWELCLPANAAGRCIVYASPKGSGTPMHFDQNANLVVQLRGEKRWQIAPNRNVVNPMEQFVAGSSQMSESTRSYCQGEMPTCMSPDAQIWNLRSGSVLFVPRAWWHDTVSLEDSLQLNFTFDQPAWIDVVIPALYRRLLIHERWRELAHGASPGDHSAREGAERRLTELLAGLTADLGKLDAGEMISELRPVASTRQAPD